MDEVVITINGKKHWLWRAVDQDGFVLDALVQSHRDKKAAKRLLRKLLRKQARAPRVLVTDKLGSYGAARKDMHMKFEHRQCQSASKIDPRSAFKIDPCLVVARSGSARPGGAGRGCAAGASAGRFAV